MIASALVFLLRLARPAPTFARTRLKMSRLHGRPTAPSPARPAPPERDREAVRLPPLGLSRGHSDTEKTRPLRGRQTGTYGYLYARSLGYAGRYDEALRFVRASLDSHPTEMLLWDALYVANRNVRSPRFTFEEYLRELPRRGGDESHRQFLIGRALFYDVLDSDQGHPDRTRLAEAARRFVRSIQLDPGGNRIDLDAYTFLFSCLFFLEKHPWCEATVRSVLLKDSTLLNRWPIDLDLTYLSPENKIILLPKLRDHPAWVLAEIDGITATGFIDTSLRDHRTGRAAAGETRIAAFPRMRYSSSTRPPIST